MQVAMKKIIYVLVVIVLAALEGCRKPYEYVEPKITSITVDTEGTRATVVARVNYQGEKFMYVDMGKTSDLSDAKRYEMSRNGDYDFSVTVKDLDFGSKYYYRLEAGNVNFSIFSDVKSVKLTEAVLKYGNDQFDTRWGLTNGGDDEWAVMFPSSKLSGFEGSSITKVEAYVAERGSCKLKLYEGGSSSPTTLVKTKQFEVTSTGWNTIYIDPISLNTEKNLWVSISMSYEAGSHPRGASKGTNNANARWVRSNGGSWRDIMTSNGNEDLTWMIDAYVSLEAKGSKDEEVKLPQVISESQVEESDCSRACGD